MDRPAKIIVLDDEAELRNMLQRFLRGHGFDGSSSIICLSRSTCTSMLRSSAS